MEDIIKYENDNSKNLVSNIENNYKNKGISLLATRIVNPISPNPVNKAGGIISVDTKVIPNTAVAYVGDALDFTITITNTSATETTGVIAFNNTLTSGLQLVAGTFKINGSSLDYSMGTLQENISAIESGKSTIIEFQLQVTSTAPTISTQDPNNSSNNITGLNVSKMLVTYGSGTEANSDYYILVPPAKVEKTASPSVVSVGGNITYTINIKNDNTSELTNVNLIDNLSSSVTFNSGSIRVNGSSTGFESQNPTTGITIGTIAASTTTVVIFDAKVANVPTGNVISNKASITYGADGSGTLESNEIATNIVGQLTVTKSATPSVSIGDFITYTINITNPGPGVANVQVLDSLSNSVSFTTGSVSVNGSSTGYESADPTTGFNISSIPANNPTVVIFKASINSNATVGSVINNTAKITGTITTPNGVSDSQIIQTNTTTTTVLKIQSTLTASTTVDKPIAKVGDTLTYTIKINNSGSNAATNVSMTDILPTGVSFVAGSVSVNGSTAGYESANPTTGITLPDVPAASAVTLVFKTNVESQADRTVASNKVNINATITLPNGTTTNYSITSSTATTNIGKVLPQAVANVVEAIALEGQALTAILNAEGKKMQASLNMTNITNEELLETNQSIISAVNAITRLEVMLQGNIDILNCQICCKKTTT